MTDTGGNEVVANTKHYPIVINTGTAAYSVVATATTPVFSYGNIVDFTLNFYKPSTNTTVNLSEQIQVRTDPPGCINHAAFKTDLYYGYLGQTLRATMGNFPCCSIYFLPQTGTLTMPNYIGVTNLLLIGGNGADVVTCPACPNGYSSSSPCTCSTPTANAKPACIAGSCGPCPNGYAVDGIFGCPSCNCAPCPTGYTANAANTYCVPPFNFAAKTTAWRWINGDTQFNSAFSTCLIYPYPGASANLVFSSYSFTAGGYNVTLITNNSTCTNTSVTQNGLTSYACCQTWNYTTTAISAQSSAWTGTFLFTTNSPSYAGYQGQGSSAAMQLNILKPITTLSTQNNAQTVSATTYGNSNLTYQTSTFYTNSKMWTGLTLNSVSACNLFTVTVINASICQGAGVNVSTCADVGATSSLIYQNPPTALQNSTWAPTIQYLNGCTSSLTFSNIARVGTIDPRQFVLQIYWNLTYTFIGFLHKESNGHKHSGYSEIGFTVMDG